jgi:peroxiredoxin
VKIKKELYKRKAAILLLDTGFRRYDDVAMIDSANHLAPGVAIPQIRLPATDGRDICLAALPGRSIVIIYPWTGRPGELNPPNWDDIQGAHGSTPELEGFRDLAPDFAELRVALYALSTQITDYQCEMAKRLKLTFPVLSDAEHMFSSALGLPSFVTGGKDYLKRLTLFIENGRIAHLFYPVTEPARHADEVLCWLGK